MGHIVNIWPILQGAVIPAPPSLNMTAQASNEVLGIGRGNIRRKNKIRGLKLALIVEFIDGFIVYICSLLNLKACLL